MVCRLGGVTTAPLLDADTPLAGHWYVVAESTDLGATPAAVL